ncbi:MAG: UDP-N-acetylmuramoyl-tripeptide--D-alanyl-D-alanine ligase, partial [Muribaculum sp.]|nr:UDP-N-acetylmuramoyl-tripeptide--D-alanyl-D-alanine ligase [Muribaculum sp.]
MNYIFSSIATMVACAIFLIIAIINIAMEYRRDLLMLQQNSYRPERYMKWLRTSGDTTSVIRILSYACVLALASPDIRIILTGIAGFTIISLCNICILARKKYKKPLVWTARAKRIYATIWLETITITVIAQVIADSSVFATIFMIALSYAASHILTLGAIYILKPVETAINRKYYHEASEILRSIPDLKVIGITGSYGKTSTKHYLERILTEQFNVLITPGSYNTTMGVIRTVREMMKPYTEVFICEMGAKNIGDIKEICDLVHPEAGIITAVGEQHMESFKTIENVQRTKFELADSLSADGTIYVNADFPYAANRPTSNCNLVLYSTRDNDAATWKAITVKPTPEGTHFTLSTPVGEYEFFTHLLGEFNISNLIPAIALSYSLGMSMDVIARAVAAIEPVEHRLSLKRTPGGITILDDAFNSNPDGSRMALDVLSKMTGGQRIIITPGMIELGERQFELNRQFGQHIAESVDYAIIVGKYNREAILDG